MNQKKKICDGCDTEQYIWKNNLGSRYCLVCWNRIKFNNNPPEVKKQKLNPKSKKQAILDIAYSKLRKRFLEEHPMCQAHLPGCQGGATDVHHKSQRCKNYLVVSSWISICRSCHNWIHFVDPRSARELGLLE